MEEIKIERVYTYDELSKICETFIEKKDYRNAIPILLKCTEMMPNKLNKFYDLARCYYKLKEYDNAKLLFNILATESADDEILKYHYYYNLGWYFIELKNADAGKACFLLAGKINYNRDVFVGNLVVEQDCGKIKTKKLWLTTKWAYEVLRNEGIKII